MKSPFDLLRNRPVSAFMLVSALGLFGLIASVRIPIALSPSVEFPALTVEVEYSGVSPDKIEEIITRPLEESISSVGGIEELNSSSEQGKSKIQIRFRQNADVALKQLEVRERVDLASAAFPRESQKPSILKYDPEQRPVMLIVLESKKLDLDTQREFAERTLKKKIKSSPEVSEVFVAGGRVREILLDCDREKLRAYNVIMTDLLEVVRKSNFNESVGLVEDGGGVYRLYVRNRYENLEAIRNTPVAWGKSGGMIRVGDVARVSMGYKEKETAARVNGQERISLYVYRKGKADLSALSREVREALEANLSKDLQYRIIYDRADTIQRAFRNLTVSSLTGLLLAFSGLYTVLGNIKRALLCCLIAPLSVFTAVFILFVFGFSLDIPGLTGMISGASIALLPACLYNLHHQNPRIWPEPTRPMLLLLFLVASTFIASALVGGAERVLYSGMGIGLVISLFSSLVLTGIISGNVPRDFLSAKKDLIAPLYLRSIKNFVGSVFEKLPVLHNRLELFARRIPSSRAFYAFGIFAVITFSLVLIGGARFSVSGGSGENQIIANVEFPSGASFGSTNKTTQKLEAKLRGLRGVREITTRVESAKSLLYIRVDPGLESDPEYLNFLRKESEGFSPAYVYIAPGEGDVGTGEITVDVLGEDLILLDKLTRELARRAEGVRGASEVVLRFKSPRPEMQVVVDKIKAERAGLSSQDIGQMLRYAIQGGIATRYVEALRETDVRIRYSKTFRSKVRDIDGIFLRNPEKRFISLKDISSTREDAIPVKIYRKDKKRTLSFSVRARDGDVNALAAELERLRKTPLPKKYRIKFEKGYERFLAARWNLYTLVAFEFGLLFMMLAAYNEDLLRPLILLVPQLLPLVVSLLLLRVCGYSFSVPMLAILILQVASGVVGLVLLENNFKGSDEDQFVARWGVMNTCVSLIFLLILLWPGESGQILKRASLIFIGGNIISLITVVPVYRRLIRVWSV